MGSGSSILLPICAFSCLTMLLRHQVTFKAGFVPSSSCYRSNHCSYSLAQRSRAVTCSSVHGSSASHTGDAAWVPPDVWVSSVMSALPSVDVDNLSQYTHLLQECLVLEPALLHYDPHQAAAIVWCVERSLRASMVWLGHKTCSVLLLSHTPDTMQQHLSGLLEVWLAAGGSPHSFGSLWLEASPSALLQWNQQSFADHLTALQELVPEMSSSRLLTSSSSLSGYLLSLTDTHQLAGHIWRLHGYLILAPHVTDLVMVEQQGQNMTGSSSSGDRPVLAVYGRCVHQQQQSEESGFNAISALTDVNHNAVSSSSKTPRAWQQADHHSTCQPGNITQQPGAVDDLRLLLHLRLRPAYEPQAGGLIPVIILPE